MILQTTFKSPIVIPMLRCSSEGEQTTWRARKKKKTIYGTIIGQISGCGKDNFVFKDLKEILP
jgi:hypothetical protein